MADNPFAKKFDKKKSSGKSDNDGDEEMPKGKHKMPDGKMMGGKGGNPFAKGKRMTGKHKPPFKKKGKRPARKGRLQKFGQSY